jgi:hypothetical protein
VDWLGCRNPDFPYRSIVSAWRLPHFPRKSQHAPASKINEAFARPESGQARYRLVLDAAF